MAKKEQVDGLKNLAPHNEFWSEKELHPQTQEPIDYQDGAVLNVNKEFRFNNLGGQLIQKFKRGAREYYALQFTAIVLIPKWVDSIDSEKVNFFKVDLATGEATPYKKTIGGDTQMNEAEDFIPRNPLPPIP